MLTTNQSPSPTEDLERLLEFETLISDLSSRFINLPPGAVDHELEDAQRRVCECLGLDLSTTWQWSAEDPGDLVMSHIYRPLGGPPTPERFVARQYFPWCLDQVLARRIISVAHVEEAPPGAARDQETWRHFGLKSVLTGIAVAVVLAGGYAAEFEDTGCNPPQHRPRGAARSAAVSPCGAPRKQFGI